ncbi:MAG: hypothetical protein MR409_03270 [Lachnospiraceae bacterium]|nr:hypothetical protein [Lachnospiraceae bacterium]
MSNIEEILKEVEKNKITLMEGTEFYYADRNIKKPVKCIIQKTELGYPATIFAKREDTNKIFKCYDGFGCYTLDNYDKAYKDAQIQEDRNIY